MSLGATSSGLRRAVLVVDDEQIIRDVSCMMLKRLGYTPLAAADGHASLQLFREHADEIDAVLIDLTMPGMGGEEVVERLREIRPQVPIVIASGCSAHGVRDRLAQMPGLTFLQKPYRCAQLQAELERLAP